MDEKLIKWLNLFDEFAEGTVLRDIFNDAIRCYRNDIARPALMLSYIAFMQAVRNNLLRSARPNDFDEEHWNAAMENLRKEEKWDETVFSCIRKKKEVNKPPFFDFPDSLRDDLSYWRNRRNDCAHYKASEITLSHVSAFWSFIMDNYHKFSPLGSLQQSINEYVTHFDISKTPAGKSTEKIFQRLALAVNTVEDLQKFIEGTKGKLTFEDQCDVLHLLLHDERHRKIVKEILNAKFRALRAYIGCYPADISIVLDSKEIIRKLWYEELNVNVWGVSIYLELMRAGMIEGEEVKESLSLLLKRDYEHKRCSIGEDNDFAMLNAKGLYDLFIDTYCVKDFLCNVPGDKCRKTDFYISYIRKGGITTNLIKVLKDAYESSFPYTLRDRLKNEIFDDTVNQNSYFTIIEKEGFDDFFHIKSNPQ